MHKILKGFMLCKDKKYLAFRCAREIHYKWVKSDLFNLVKRKNDDSGQIRNELCQEHKNSYICILDQSHVILIKRIFD